MKKLIITEEEKLHILNRHNLITEEVLVPFKNTTEGNEFRKWVNQNYPQVAQRYRLDPSGPFNNQNITWAWNHKLGNETLGRKYFNSFTSLNIFGNKQSNTTPKTNAGEYAASKVTFGTKTTVPFKNTTEGNEFRAWVIKNYPNVAKTTSLSPTGEYNNSYITNAWNYKIGNETLGTKYSTIDLIPSWMKDNINKSEKESKKEPMGNKEDNTSTFDDYQRKYKGRNWYGIDPEATKQYSKFGEAEPEDYYQTKGYKKRSIELNPNITGEFVGGDRINKEVYYIKENNKNKGKPFLVVDPRMNIVAAYNSNYKLIDYSQTVKGKDSELLKPHTYEEWCKDSGGIRYNGVCVKPGKQKDYDKELHNYKTKKSKAGLDVTKHDELEKEFNSELRRKGISGLDYGKLVNTAAASPGVFVGGKPEIATYGNPIKSVPNSIGLVTLAGESLPTAIHGLADHLPGRTNLDAKLKTFLKKEKLFGNIPKEYDDLVNNMAETKNYGLSSGCFNVENKFIQNPKVTEILNAKPYIFVMSQEKDYYLVQMDSNQGTQFFNELKGDGNSCKNPISIANNVGGQPIDVRTA